MLPTESKKRRRSAGCPVVNRISCGPKSTMGYRPINFDSFSIGSAAILIFLLPPRSTDAENSLDLPQTMLARGVQSYVANTGYGWGIKHGIGYSERLVEILTEELTQPGTLVMGKLVTQTKQRYYMETPRLDDYDAKSLMQWAFFGLPMYAVITGIEAEPSGPTAAGERLGGTR